MKALDTNVLVRLLVGDDRAQAQRARALLEQAEGRGESHLVTTLVVLELIWVLTAVYELERADVLDALDQLTQMPVLAFEQRDTVQSLVRLGRETRADLPDLLIGLAGRAAGAETTLTFDRALAKLEPFDAL